jgi:hypothetical protein
MLSKAYFSLLTIFCKIGYMFCPSQFYIFFLGRVANVCSVAPSRGKKRTFGQILKPANITSKTFAEVAEINSFFVDKTVLCEEAEQWFQIDVLGVEEGSSDKEAIDTGNGLINEIQRTTQMDERLQELLVRPTAALPEGITTADRLVYNQGRIEVLAGNDIRQQILRSRHDSRLAGHPGRARTLELVRRCYTWPSLKKFVNQYVNRCDSCQRVKPSSLRLF